MDTSSKANLIPKFDTKSGESYFQNFDKKQHETDRDKSPTIEEKIKFFKLDELPRQKADFQISTRTIKNPKLPTLSIGDKTLDDQDTMNVITKDFKRDSYTNPLLNTNREHDKRMVKADGTRLSAFLATETINKDLEKLKEMHVLAGTLLCQQSASNIESQVDFLNAQMQNYYDSSLEIEDIKHDLEILSNIKEVINGLELKDESPPVSAGVERPKNIQEALENRMNYLAKYKSELNIGQKKL